MLFQALTFSGSCGSCLNLKPLSQTFKHLKRDPEGVSGMKNKTCNHYSCIFFTWLWPNYIYNALKRRLTHYLLVSSADNLCKQIGQNVGPDLNPICLTLWWYSWIFFFWKSWFWKNSGGDKKTNMKNFPGSKDHRFFLTLDFYKGIQMSYCHYKLDWNFD